MRDYLGLGPGLEPGGKLLGRPWVKVRLGLGGGVVLVLGSLLAPGSAQPVLSVPDDRVVPLLEAQVNRRETETGFGGVQSAARGAARHTIALPAATPTRRPSLMPDYAAPANPATLPAGFGVVVSEGGDILTHDVALDGQFRTRVQTAGGTFENARVTAFEKATGLAMLRMEGVAGQQAPAFGPRAEPGALLVAVGQFDGRLMTQPAFVSTVGPDAYTVSTAGESLPAGTPLFDLEGRLVAIATGGDVGRAFPAGEAVSRLTARISAGQGHDASVGLVFQVLDEALMLAFGTQGALVSDVVPGGPADIAGLTPGDVLVAVNRLPVDSADSALRALASLTVGSEALLQIVRDGKPEEHTVASTSAFEVAARARAAAPVDGAVLMEAGTLWPADRLAEAGIAPGARVLRINRREVTSRAQALREIARTTPTVLYLWEDGRLFHAVLEGRP